MESIQSSEGSPSIEPFRSIRETKQRGPAWMILAVAVLVISMLGLRSLWDPDEGRYTNVALTMLSTGDWVYPKRNDDTGHWTKPPLTYWAIAGSVSIFGHTPFAARLPSGIAYLASIFLVLRIGRRLTPGYEHSAALTYATMLLPVGAAQLITSDFMLAAFQTAAIGAFIEARYASPVIARRWSAMIWLAFGLAFLTKGPPGLLALLPIIAYERLVPTGKPSLLWSRRGALLFALVTVPWYFTVVTTTPGLLGYFLGTEVLDRVAGSGAGRHPEWYGWLQVYVPTLLIGTFPWTIHLLRWFAGLPSKLRRWKTQSHRAVDANEFLLALWVLLPLAVFCLSRSRLPLYILPLFAPLALLITHVRIERSNLSFSLGRNIMWLVTLSGIVLGASLWHSHKRSDIWATAITERAPWPVHEVVFVEDMARYGLKLHLGVEIEKVSLESTTARKFNPEYDEAIDTELPDIEDGVVFVCKTSAWDDVRRKIESLGYVALPLGEPHEGRVIFRVIGQRTAADPQPIQSEKTIVTQDA